MVSDVFTQCYVSKIYPGGGKEIEFIVSTAVENSIVHIHICLPILFVMNTFVVSNFHYHKQLCDEYPCTYLVMVLKCVFVE